MKAKSEFGLEVSVFCARYGLSLKELAAEAGTPGVTAESGASWCSIQAEHARGSVLYTIRAVGESGTEEQVRTSLDRVLETWLLAPEGEKTSKIC